MSYNGAGAYSLPAGQPVVTGTVISSATFNVLTADIATAFNTAWCRDGQAVPTANIPMNAFKLTGLGTGSASSDSVRHDQVFPAIYRMSISGRLTLVSGTPVMTSEQLAKTSAYFTPYGGDSIPIYDGTNMVPTTFAELTLALDSNSGHTGYQQSGKSFDCFVVNDNGTIRLGTGPAWSSDTSRGTGAGTTEFEWVKGVRVNKQAITLRYGSAAGDTLSLPAQRGTLVGSIRMSADGQTQWKIGSAAAGGGEIWLGVSNVYNRVRFNGRSEDTTGATYTYQSVTVRAMNASNGNRASYIDCLGETPVEAIRQQYTGVNASADYPQVAFGLDSTSAVAAACDYGVTGLNTSLNGIYRASLRNTGLGFHYMQAVERCSAATAPITFYLTSGVFANNSIQFSGEF